MPKGIHLCAHKNIGKKRIRMKGAPLCTYQSRGTPPHNLHIIIKKEFHMQNLSHNTQTYLQDYHLDLNHMISSMTTVQLNDSISHNFIEQMIPHHMMAINMCKNLLQYTTCINLQNMAHDTIREQRESIWKMQKCLEQCSKKKNCEIELGRYQQHFTQVSRTMFYQMEQACEGNSIDRNFCREMIPHHMGALEMCDNVLEFPICKQLQPIINSILDMQTKGIKDLRCILDMSK